jgi:hypothetical protein
MTIKSNRNRNRNRNRNLNPHPHAHLTRRQQDLLTNIKRAESEQNQEPDRTDQDIIALALELYYELENPREMLH